MIYLYILPSILKELPFPEYFVLNWVLFRFETKTCQDGSFRDYEEEKEGHYRQNGSWVPNCNERQGGELRRKIEIT